MSNIHECLKKPVELALKAGYRVFIAEKGTYGFITNKDGSVLLSMQFDGLRFSTGGNYRPVKQSDGRLVGQGWRVGEEWPVTCADIHRLMKQASKPPRWATNGIPVRLATLQDQLNSYQKSSRYTEVFS
jgi:hypothetical protein